MSIKLLGTGLFLITYFTTLAVKASEYDKKENIRNPFVFLRREKSQVSGQKELALMGLISCGKKKCAILSCCDESCIVEKGQTFEGYKLAYIGKNFITINKGKKQKKLYLE